MTRGKRVLVGIALGAVLSCAFFCGESVARADVAVARRANPCDALPNGTACHTYDGNDGVCADTKTWKGANARACLPTDDASAAVPAPDAAAPSAIPPAVKLSGDVASIGPAGLDGGVDHVVSPPPEPKKSGCGISPGANASSVNALLLAIVFGFAAAIRRRARSSPRR